MTGQESRASPGSSHSRESPSRLLLLEFDELLASCVILHPRGPALPRGLRRLLRGVHERGDTLVIASARPVEELRRLTRGVPAHLIGEHGWEELRPDGHEVFHPLPTRTERRLAQAVAAAEACGWGQHLVIRRCSARLVCAMLPDGEGELMGEMCSLLWCPKYETDDLVFHATSSGPELRAGGQSVAGAVARITRMSAGPVAVTEVRRDLAKLRPRAPRGETSAASPAAESHGRIGVGHPREILTFLRTWVREDRPPARAD